MVNLSKRMVLIFDNIRNIDYPAIIGYPANYRLYREYR